MINKDRAINLSIIFLFIALPILLWWEAFLIKGVFVYGDAGVSFFPFRTYTFQSLLKGTLPLWTPYINNGHPFLAIFSTAVFYPLNLLFLLFPVYIGWNYSIILHYILAGIFMYFYLKEVGLQSSCALFGGIVFMFNGFLISHLEHTTMVAAAIWLPLIFMLIEKLIKTKRYIYSLILGLIIGTQLLAGYPQISLYTFLAIGGYVIFHFISMGIINKDFGLIRFLVSSLMIAFIIGIGLFAIQFFPTCELIKLSSRAHGLTLAQALDYSLPPWYFISLLMPYLITDPLLGQGCLSDKYINICEVMGYCGVLPLLYGVFGIFFYRNRQTTYFTILLFTSLLLTLGKYTPLYSLIYHLPGFNFIRIPARFFYLYTFSLSILAAFGMQYLIISKNHPLICKIMSLFMIIIFVFSLTCWFLKPLWIKLIENTPSLISSYYTIGSYSNKSESLYSFILGNTITFSGLFIISSLLIIVYLGGKIKPIHFKWVSILLIISDLFICWYAFNPLANPQIYTVKPKTAKFLLKDNSLYRICSLLPRDNDIWWVRIPNHSWRIKEIIIGDLCMLYGIQSMYGYTDPLTFFRIDKFIKKLQYSPVPKHPKLHSLLNVKYLLSSEKIDDDRLKLVGNFPYGVRIYRNKGVLPRAFIVHRIKVVHSEHQSLNEIFKTDFEPKLCAVLEEPVEEYVRRSMPYIPYQKRISKIGTDKVKISKYLPNQVIINAQLSSNGILVLSDTYYPGWKVYIDGKMGRIYKTNYLVRGVFLTQGRHQVKFVYDPWTFKLGAWITITTLLATLGAIVFMCNKTSF